MSSKSGLCSCLSVYSSRSTRATISPGGSESSEIAYSLECFPESSCVHKIPSFATLDTRQFVKRVAAVEGDYVEVDERGAVAVGGAARAGRCAVGDPSDAPSFERASGRVPRGAVYVLGDCPSKSVDSRSWGALPVSNVAGRPLLRVWPPARAGLLR